jgi:hypothetical protein
MGYTPPVEVNQAIISLVVLDKRVEGAQGSTLTGALFIFCELNVLCFRSRTSLSEPKANSVER